LNKKIFILEVRQNAAGVDPRGDADSAFAALESLLNAEQLEAAKDLAKAFLN
jgi:hypothetical protein